MGPRGEVDVGRDSGIKEVRPGVKRRGVDQGHKNGASGCEQYGLGKRLGKSSSAAYRFLHSIEGG